MVISFSNEQIQFNLTEKQRVKRWIKEVVRREGKEVGEIGYLFCDDATLLRANQEYLQHDTYTDIITFDYVEGNVVNGDIMISVERLRENAKSFGVPLEQELRRVIIHGVLHLLGQKDKLPADATAMRNRENAALKLWETI
ncbi:MAG: rRNA maturation RNase YbeY [Bacteroidales bacterium]|nr:rRNA maturation RNase YbeY [Bacteroidales bacterium]